MFSFHNLHFFVMEIIAIYTDKNSASCKWIDEPKNLITGSAGAGKTHIANALCITALQQLRTVKYIRANALLQESEKHVSLVMPTIIQIRWRSMTCW